MKESRYNFWLKYKHDQILLFNAIHNGFALVNEDAIHLLNNYIDNKISIDTLADEHKEVINNFINGGYIIDDSIDEIATLKIRNRINSFANHTLSMTILPTLDCNFNCTYCFETKKSCIMNKQVVEAIQKYVIQKFEVYPYKSIGVSWFGGEPLLGMEVIRDLSKFFIDFSRSKNVPYSAHMITNGWLLNSQIAKELYELHVESVQVTFDGSKSNHNKKRKLKNNEGTFERILNNVLATSEKLNIALRVNSDNETRVDLVEMFKDLKILAGNSNISVYPGKLSSDVTSICSSVESNCLEVEQFARLYKPFYETAMENGFKLSWYVRSAPGGCGATSNHSTVIQPDGSLCRCWSQVGCDEESYGNILYTGKFNGDNYYKWLLYDPFEKKECIECKFLPICVGGCPAKHIPATTPYMASNNRGDNFCTSARYNLEEMLVLLYETKMKLESSNKGQLSDHSTGIPV